MTSSKGALPAAVNGFVQLVSLVERPVGDHQRQVRGAGRQVQRVLERVVGDPHPREPAPDVAGRVVEAVVVVPLERRRARVRRPRSPGTCRCATRPGRSARRCRPRRGRQVGGDVAVERALLQRREAARLAVVSERLVAAVQVDAELTGLARQPVSEGDGGLLARRAADRRPREGARRRSTSSSCGRAGAEPASTIGMSRSAAPSAPAGSAAAGGTCGAAWPPRRARGRTAAAGAATPEMTARPRPPRRPRRTGGGENAARRRPVLSRVRQLLDVELAPHERVNDAEVADGLADLGRDLAGLTSRRARRCTRSRRCGVLVNFWSQPFSPESTFGLPTGKSGGGPT